MKNHPAAIIASADTAINRISYLNNQASEYRQVHTTIYMDILRMNSSVYRQSCGVQRHYYSASLNIRLNSVIFLLSY